MVVGSCCLLGTILTERMKMFVDDGGGGGDRTIYVCIETLNLN